MNNVLVILIGIIVAECAIPLIGRRLPDGNGWKLYAAIAFCLLMAGICVYLPLSEKLLRVRGGKINAVACERAEILIRDGRRTELREALRQMDWFKETRAMDFPEVAAMFLQKVEAAEEDGKWK